jgi:hypothetical protein
MREILHILKKDVRRHWPEVLISLIFLGLYVRVAIHNQGYRSAGYSLSSLFWFRASEESIPPLMIGFWIFLTLRVIHGEALVGDRQWWVTKPYEWWKLLAAKELFLLLFIGAPLFLAQLYFLRHAGFPVFPNVLRILNMQLGLALILFLPAVALGSLTKGLGQALVGIALAILTLWATFALLEKVPSSGMSSAVEGSGEITGILILAAIVAAIGWQYARRKTWASRGLLASGVVAVILLAALTPYAMFVEKRYALQQASDAPLQAAAQPVPPIPKKKATPSDFMSDVYLRIPLVVSGVAPRRVVMLDGIRISFETSGGAKWDPGWKPQFEQIWPEDDEKNVTFQIRRKEFEERKTLPLHLNIELAITEFEAREPRELVLPESEFTDVQLGICRLNESIPSAIQCRRLFSYPGLMASFDPTTSNCEPDLTADQLPEDRVTHAWYAPHDDDSPSAGLNPVITYSVDLGSRRWVSSPDGRRKLKVAHLCSGAKVLLAKPYEMRHSRLKLEMENVRFQDLAVTDFTLE